MACPNDLYGMIGMSELDLVIAGQPHGRYAGSQGMSGSFIAKMAMLMYLLEALVLFLQSHSEVV